MIADEEMEPSPISHPRVLEGPLMRKDRHALEPERRTARALAPPTPPDRVPYGRDYIPPRDRAWRGSFFSFRTLRAASPGLLPVVLGGACFALVIVLSMGPVLSTPPVIDPLSLPSLFFVYAAAGVVLAAALAYAPNDTIWSLALFAGLIVYGTLTAGAIFGIAAALALVIGLTVLLIVMVRSLMHTVLEDTVHVMVFFGKHNRILHPGFNLRLPGERVWAVVSATPETVIVALPSVALFGTTPLAVAATMECAVPPARAHLAATHSADWPEQARRCLELALRETLSDLEPQEFDATPVTIHDLMQNTAVALRVKGHVQQLTGGWGIQILWVRLHPIMAEPSPNTARIAEFPPAFAPKPDVASGAHAAVYADSRTASAPKTRRIAANLPDLASRRSPRHDPLLPLPPAMDLGTLAPDALADMYTAVRKRDITDPATIACIAEAFERLADDPILSRHLPYDAEQAATLLRRLLRQMQPARHAPPAPIRDGIPIHKPAGEISLISPVLPQKKILLKRFVASYTNLTQPGPVRANARAVPTKRRWRAPDGGAGQTDLMPLQAVPVPTGVRLPEG